jgi:steroid delta-isomerase-like uncharacterized protein
MSQSAPELNTKVVERYVAACNRGDAEAMARLFTPDAAVHGTRGRLDLAAARRLWGALFAAFPDLHLGVEEVVAAGDCVAARYTERGTFTGPLMGQAPTGRPYTITALEWFRIVDGRIRERWAVRDSAAMFRQLGVAAPPPAAVATAAPTAVPVLRPARIAAHVAAEAALLRRA